MTTSTIVIHVYVKESPECSLIQEFSADEFEGMLEIYNRIIGMVVKSTSSENIMEAFLDYEKRKEQRKNETT